MKLFLLDDPAKPGEFARFSHVGTWSEGSLCEGCGAGTERLVEPLQIEWNPGTERIGAFSWCGYTCIVTDDVRDFLEEAEADCTFGRVEVVAPTRKTRHSRVRFPYTGPRLHWLIPTRRLPLIESASGVKLISDCSRCGQRRYNFKRDGLVVEAGTGRKAKVFLVRQFEESGATFVTDEFLAEIQSRGFSNLKPCLAGNIV